MPWGAIPIIVDCDPGVDDAVALLLAIASPELDLVAVTVAGGNAPLAYTLANALAVTALAGAPVPVHAGADRPLLGRFAAAPRVHGAGGLGGVRLPPGGAAVAGVAADAIRNLLRAAENPVTLIGIAPATNLALALMTEPALAERVAEIVLMAGAWGEGGINAAAEFNAWSDPEALAVLLASGRPVRLATLDLTAQALVTPERIAALRRRGAGACLAAACDMLAALPALPRYGGEGAPLHDPCAVAWLIRPSLFTVRECAVAVELAAGPGRGRTWCDRWGQTGAPVNATLLESLAVDAFFDVLGERLARLP
jgi:inosine-uridine nucleoside N-ribohydrolase